MIIRGQFGYSLGGFTCIRGFATLGDLARISHCDKDFQRELITSHRKQIEYFLDQTNYLFFPEVILSLQLERKKKNDSFSLKDIEDKKSFTSHQKKIKFKIRKTAFRNPGDSRVKDIVRTIEVDIDESLISKVSEEKRPFFRIDGNHRLSASALKASFSLLSTPFCLLLFEEDHNPINAFEKIIFHNINSKSIPLTPEENLRVILDEDKIFTDDLLKSEPPFGWEYYFARKLEPLIDINKLDGLQNIFKDNNDKFQIKTVYIQLFKLLLDKKLIKRQDNEVDKIQRAITKINLLFENYIVLKKSKSISLFISFIYYELDKQEGDKSEIFLKWILQNHLYEL